MCLVPCCSLQVKASQHQILWVSRNYKCAVVHMVICHLFLLFVVRPSSVKLQLHYLYRNIFEYDADQFVCGVTGVGSIRTETFYQAPYKPCQIHEKSTFSHNELFWTSLHQAFMFMCITYRCLYVQCFCNV